jgi:hypothetical protein
MTPNTYTDDGVKKTYYTNGIVSREDGPAVIYRDGKVEYWLNGKQVNKEEVDKLSEEKLNSRKVLVTVDNREFILTAKQVKDLNLISLLEAAVK